VFAAARRPARLVTIEGAGHALVATAGPTPSRAILDFVATLAP
jgi:hypothetical protein